MARAARGRIGTDVGLSVRMLVTMFLLAALYTGFLWVLWQAGAGPVAMIFVAAVMLGFQYYFCDKMVLWSMRAKIVSPGEEPQLYAMLERLAAQADLPTPKLAMVETSMPNAFATGRNYKNAVVAVTRGLVQRLDPPEVEAVIAHELAHIKHRDVALMTFASFFATVASLIVQNYYYLVIFGGMSGRRDDRNGNAAALVWLASMLVWFLSYFLIRALSRYREFAADRGAAAITGQPANLMSALVKISGVVSRIPEQDLRRVEGMNAFFIIPAFAKGSLSELFSTHPSLERRLANLRKIEAEMRGR